AARSFVARIDAFAYNYKPEINRYECTANVEYDPKAAEAILRGNLFTGLMSQQLGQLLYIDERKFAMVLDTALAEARREFRSPAKLRFSVQQSTRSGYHVDLDTNNFQGPWIGR